VSPRLPLLAAALAGGLSLPAAALAQDAVRLPEVVIYAHQVAAPASHVASAVTVITAQEIAQRHLTTVADALRTVPGVSITQSGGPGTLTEVRMRGAENNHLLVLVDDVPVNDADTGALDFADLSLADVERIEVIRGPQSGIYGAGAHSGVIAIVTKSGRGLRKPAIDGYVDGGTRGTADYALNLRGSAGRVYGALGISGTRTDGFNVSRHGWEEDPSRAFTTSAKLGMDVTDALNVEGMLRYTRRFTQTDSADFTTGRATDAGGNWNDVNRDQALIGRIAATFKALDGHLVQTAALSGYGHDYRNDGIFGPYTNRSRRFIASHKITYWRDTPWLGGARQTFSLLADHAVETYADSYIPGVTYRRDRTGLAGEWLIDFRSGLSLSAALREDWNSDFADATTWRLTAVQRLPHDLRLHASIGRGVTDPTFDEQFGRFYAARFVGNPDLRPESSIGWDAGIGKGFFDNRLTVDATWFAARFTDKIAASYIPCPFNPALTCTREINLPGISPRQGIELTLSATPVDWLTLTGSYTYTLAQDATGLEEIRVPRHAGHVGATVRFADGKGHASVGVDLGGTRADVFYPLSGAQRVFLPASAVVDASLSYDIRPDLTVYLRGMNLLNARVQNVYSYYGPGTVVLAGLRMHVN